MYLTTVIKCLSIFNYGSVYFLRKKNGKFAAKQMNRWRLGPRRVIASLLAFNVAILPCLTIRTYLQSFSVTHNLENIRSNHNISGCMSVCACARECGWLCIYASIAMHWKYAINTQSTYNWTFSKSISFRMKLKNDLNGDRITAEWRKKKCIVHTNPSFPISSLYSTFILLIVCTNLISLFLNDGDQAIKKWAQP